LEVSFGGRVVVELAAAPTAPVGGRDGSAAAGVADIDADIGIGSQFANVPGCLLSLRRC
jgi:hypothetical protein